jgi:hypothetical protein
MLKIKNNWKDRWDIDCEKQLKYKIYDLERLSNIKEMKLLMIRNNSIMINLVKELCSNLLGS